MRRLLAVVAAALATIFLLAIGLFLRLTQGPIAVDFLTPRITAALHELDPGLRVRIGATVLVWDADEGDIDLRVTDVEIEDPAEERRGITIPSVALRTSLASLLRGEFVITGVDVVGADLTLVRQADGQIHLGLSGSAAAPLPEAVPAPLGADGPLRRISHLGLRNGSIAIEDRAGGRTWRARDVDIDVTPSEDGVSLGISAEVALGDLVPEGVGPARLTLEGQLSSDADAFELRDLRVDVGDLDLRAHGRATGLRQADPRMEIEMQSSGLVTSALSRHWPPALAPEARAWVLRHITKGGVRDVSARLVADRPAAGFRLQRLDGTAGFRDLEVRFLDNLPPVTGVEGSVRFSLAGADFSVTRGRLRELEVSAAKVGLPATGVPRITIEADVAGPLTTAFSVLDQEPVGLSRLLGFTPRAGSLSGRVGFAFPLRDGLAIGDLGLNTEIRVAGAAVDRIAGDWSLTAGDFDVSLRGVDLKLDGGGRIQEVPLRVSLRDRIDSPGRTRLEVDGSVDSAGLARLGFDPGARLGGTVAVRAVLVPTGRDEQAVDVSADLTRASLDLASDRFDKASGSPGTAAARVRLAKGAVTAIESLRVSYEGNTLAGNVTRARGEWRTVNLQANIPDPKAKRSAATARLDIRATGDFDLHSADAGAILAVLGSEHVHGGRMDFGGSIDLNHAAVPISGRLRIDDVTVTDSPLLTRLITLASLRGMMAVVTREGIRFQEVRAVLAHRGGVVTIRDGVARGPEIGLLTSGTIEPANRAIDLKGSVVPSYFGINETLGDIPILGRLLTGGRGKGIQAIDFRARGTFDDPKVTVNPLSSLTPQGLQDLWRRLLR